jgi:hypothetical protein
MNPFDVEFLPAASQGKVRRNLIGANGEESVHLGLRIVIGSGLVWLELVFVVIFTSGFVAEKMSS